MRKEKTQPETYDSCLAEGSFLPLSKVDKDHIRAMITISLGDLAAAQEWAKIAPKDGSQWNAIYKLHYDVLHMLSEAFLLFDALKAKTHECLFAYLCEKHPELEFNWNFFEIVRTRRNRSLYYGELISYAHWKEIALQITVYISTLEEAINRKLNETTT